VTRARILGTCLLAILVSGVPLASQAQTATPPRLPDIDQIADGAWSPVNAGTVGKVRAVQIGTANRLAVSQVGGDANLAIIAQTGIGNEIDLRQNGDANVAVLDQQGDGNLMQVEQTGQANRLIWIQNGDHLSQPTVVMPGGVVMTIIQTGP
jgi:Curlin associated repeat